MLNGWLLAAQRRQRLALALLLLVATCCGLVLAKLSGDQLMHRQGFGSGTPTAFLLLLMWVAMMLAMMLPTALPAILTFAAMNARLAPAQPPWRRAAAFVAGYVSPWLAFSLAVALLQIAVAEYVPVTGMMAVSSQVAGGLLLLAAGFWQFTPLKATCLRRCQSPMLLFARHWPEGPWRLGLRHGTDCLICCWLLMGLLFYGGVMQPLWIIGLAAYVAAEKLAAPALGLSRWSGAILILWGAATLATALA